MPTPPKNTPFGTHTLKYYFTDSISSIYCMLPLYLYPLYQHLRTARQVSDILLASTTDTGLHVWRSAGPGEAGFC